MSFWDLGEDLQAGGNFEMGGGDISPIPNDTTVLALIDEAKWDESREGDRYISLRWSVISPDDYKNRKVFQKLWVQDDDPKAKDPEKKREKAKRFLAAVDFNCGGKLVASGKAPTNESLMSCLSGKPMHIKVMVWEMDGKEGNWVASVAPKSAGTAKKKAAPVQQNDDEDAPF
jgi:hypothetical protein